MVASYPIADPANRADDELESQLSSALDAVKAVRALRASYNLPPKARPEVFLVCRSEETSGALNLFADAVSTLSSSGITTVLGENDATPAGCGVTVVSESLSVFVNLAGSVDPAAEIGKLEKKIAATAKQISELTKKMQMDGYETKVPESVRRENEEKMAKLDAEVAAANAATEDFRKLL
jgi:valyl-tRNA synthetase